MASEEVQRIDLLLSLRRPGEAEQLTREGLSANPDWATGYSLLALCLLNARPPQVEDALFAARRGIALAPTIGSTHAILGCALSATGDETASERAFREGLRLNPADTFTRSQFGWSLYRRGKVYQALVLAEEGRTDAPNDPLLLELLAYAELELTDFHNARQTISAALAAHPENHVFHYLSGLASEQTATPCQADLPLYEAAVASYAEAVRIAPTIEEYRDHLDQARAALAQVREELHLLPFAPRPGPPRVTDGEPDPGDDQAVEDDLSTAPEFLAALEGQDRTDDYKLSRPMTRLRWLGTYYPWLLIGGLVGFIMLAGLISALTR